MKPNQPKLLLAALEKFELLTYRQIAEIFRGQIHGRSVERCIAYVTRNGSIKRHQFSAQKNCIYAIKKTPFLVLQKLFVEKHEKLEFQFHHRAACTDVMISLARREFVSKIVPEHELRNLPAGSPVVGRRPDGLFILKRGDDQPNTAAIEVETTLRNPERIQEVIKAYVDTFIKYPDRLSGVLIVAITPVIANAYRNGIERVPENHRSRFVLSERIDISDVKETILGRTYVPLLENPKCPLINLAGDRQSKPLKIEPALSR